MKQFRLALIFSVLALRAAHAQRDSEPIPDFTNLDEFIYEPKTTLTLGVRSLSGAKTSFSGQGLILSPDVAGNATDSNIPRLYHDGDLQPDGRGTAVDNGDGTITFVPITPDGKTNGWGFLDDRQATQFPGYIAMHDYSATITDVRARSRDGQGSMGVELAVARDMGKLFNTRFTWTLGGGVTINDINAASNDKVRANINTITDLYSLYGELAPAGPYDSRSATSTVVVTDGNGNPVLNADGSTQTVTTDAAVLLGNTPVQRITTSTTDDTSVSHNSKLKGAYYTFRAGPTLWMPITHRFRVSISLGATLIYAGTNYTLIQSFQPETGAEISETLESDESKFLPGYYADATLQFDVTPRTGFYAGAMFQSSGDYEQNIADGAGTNYSSKLEFGNQSGFRAGMTIKF
ncbi:MAG TPA: hypothetical protein VHO24_00775 [Opitutaceae bacterium]|nr:hypothetical protein [Opitutaceae bacterium]